MKSRIKTVKRQIRTHGISMFGGLWCAQRVCCLREHICLKCIIISLSALGVITVRDVHGESGIPIIWYCIEQSTDATYRSCAMYNKVQEVVGDVFNKCADYVSA